MTDPSRAGGNLDPHAKKILDILAATGASDVSRLSPTEMRERFTHLMRLLGPRAETSGPVEDRQIPGAAAPIPIRVYTPHDHKCDRFPGLVYFHGGGCVFGDIDTHDGLCRILSNASGCRVLSVGYRLAPEHRFPAAVEDSWAAVEWVFGHADALGLEPERIAVGGDSAGGGLAATVCQRAVREGGPRVALQVLLCPALDMASEFESRRTLSSGYFLDQATIDWMLGHYCPPHLDRADPRLSPLCAGDLAGQPPTHIHTAEFDPLRCEGHAYADKLRDAGVAVRYTCHPGMIHHFYGMVGAIPYARTALEALGSAVRQSLA